MFRLLNKLFVLLCAMNFISCGLADFRQIEISIEPDLKDFILPQQYSPVIVGFDTEMIKKDTESILQINSDSGAVSGDKFWKENQLHFVPINGWTAGVRYTLSFSGQVRSADGRELRVGYFNSFYAVNKNEPPLLERCSPASGASVGINNNVLEFNFSRSMDRLSVESAFSLDGASDRNFEWSDEDKILKIIPQRPLVPWVLYQWEIKNSAKSADGVPVPKTYSGFFTTDLDQTLPAVTRIFPVLNADGLWYPTGLDIETGLGSGQAIAVEFNKPMGENIHRSLRFEPSVSGRLEYLSEKSVVYIFLRDPQPETEYTLTISGDAKDKEDLKLGEDYKINFIPDIPLLKVFSIKIDDKTFNVDVAAGNAVNISINPKTEYFSLSVYFSYIFGFDEKLNTPQRISLEPFFPGTLSPVAVEYVNWVSDDRLFIRWEGITAAKEEPNYYRLTIPGGKSGIYSSAGIYMKEDVVIYLEAVK